MRIDNLPRNSGYVEAVSLDEELAEQVIRSPAPKGPPVRMRDWSPQLEVLTLLVDRLGEVIQAVIAAQGGKPPKITPMPRPKTAVDDLRDPRRQHHRILSKVLIAQPDGSTISAADLAARRHPGPRFSLS
jgi:hypothetical protein